MTNGIDKKALFNLKSEPYLRPISDLGVGFYNLDENTAILRFQLSNTKGPLLIHENNLTAYAYFESSNGSSSDVIELEIEDSFNGIVTITLDKAFLQASTSTKVKGQVYIGVNNIDKNPEYNEVAVFREFTFEVADALINKISSFTKIEYIRMFDQLKTRIDKQVQDIEEAIANGDDFVAEMKSVLQQGIETINNTISDSKTEIKTFIDQAKIDVTQTKNNAISDINTISNNANSSVTNASETAVNSIEATSLEATEHVDTKVAEFNQTVEDNGFVTPEKLTEDLSSLEWQKYKLTNEDGGFDLTSLAGDVDTLHSLLPGNYYTTSTPIKGASSTAGYINVEYRGEVATSINKRITFRPYNSAQIWVKRFYNEWSEWERADASQVDTGWIDLKMLNGALTNTAYTDKGGFKTAYRIVKTGNVTTNYLRVNGSKMTNNQIILQLPSTMVKNAQTFPLRTPTNRPLAYVTVYTDGTVAFLINRTSNENDWIETDYIYGEVSWIN